MCSRSRKGTRSLVDFFGWMVGELPSSSLSRFFLEFVEGDVDIDVRSIWRNIPPRGSCPWLFGISR